MTEDKVNQEQKDESCYTIGIEQRSPVIMSMFISFKVIVIGYIHFYL